MKTKAQPTARRRLGWAFADLPRRVVRSHHSCSAMDRRNQRSRRAMRDIHKLSGMLDSIVQSGGAGANAARRLLHWASAHSEITAASVGEGGVDGSLDAGDADDADDDAQPQRQRLQQLQQHQQQQQQPQQHQLIGSSGSMQLDAADGAEISAPLLASLARLHEREHPHQLQRQQQQHDELQQHSQQSVSSNSVMWQPQPLLRAGPEQWDQWDFRRRSGGFHKNRCGAGNAAGTREALLRYSTLSLVCCTPGCCALVDLKVARRQAKQAGRACFEAGDGCAGLAPCSTNHRPARFAQRQHKQAAELEAGRRLLACWPADLAEREVWHYSLDAAREAAAAARAAL